MKRSSSSTRASFLNRSALLPHRLRSRPRVDGDGADAQTRALPRPAHLRLDVLFPRTSETLAVFAVVVASGLLVVSGAFALSRIGATGAEPLFWLGLLAIVVPAAVRLTSSGPTRTERLTLVVLVGLALYLVHVAYQPFQFASADELVHAYNADEIVRTGSLFGANPILSVTPHYPGLETVTAALASLTGLGTFASGIVVLGAARLVLMLALFLLFEVVSDSPRLAGLAALLYVANPNFLYFDSQFSYESLALPLVVAVLFCVARWMRSRAGGHRVAEAAVICLLIVAVVTTHHMSSYALAVFLALVAAVEFVRRHRAAALVPGAFAGFTVVAILVWLVFAASDTVGYLDPVFTKAFGDTVRTITHEGAPRQLFASAGEGSPQPLWDRLVALAGAAVIALSLPLGLHALWRAYRRRSFAILFGLAALGYIVVLALRLVPGAWEVGSRASEFLFIGSAFVLAAAILEARSLPLLVRDLAAGLDRVRSVLRRVADRLSGHAPVPPAHPRIPTRPAGTTPHPSVARLQARLSRAPVWAGPVTVAALVALVFAGGLIAGKPNDLRLARPLAVSADGTTIRPEGSLAADWVLAELGSGHRIAADPSNGRLLLAYGDQMAFTGKDPDVNAVIRTPRLKQWQVALLRENRIAYVLVDRRLVSDSASRGYFFCATGGCPVYAPRSVRKFDRAGVSRLFDSGDLVLYDVRGLWNASSSR